MAVICENQECVRKKPKAVFFGKNLPGVANVTKMEEHCSVDDSEASDGITLMTG